MAQGSLSRALGVLAASTALAAACSPDMVNFSAGGGDGGDPSTSSSSSSSSSSMSTSSTTTTTTTTTTDPSCGDNLCEPPETNANCPQDCLPPPTCAHAVCEVGQPLAPECDPCVATVCGMDPFCCDDTWDDQCIAGADAACGTACCGNGACEGQTCDACAADCGACVCGDNGCNGGETCADCPGDCGICASCAHTVCATGAALSTTACKDPCTMQVCAQDPSCCGGPNFDAGCEALAASLCTMGDPCVAAVCAQSPSCCNGSWNAACVNDAEALCNTGCNCAHSVCNTGMALAPGCNPCVAAVCAVDDYCCNTGWDGICVDEVSSICGVICN
jgi:hypothetical protein